MTGPWAKYQKGQNAPAAPEAAGPWSKYQKTEAPKEEEGGGFLDTAKDVAASAASGVARGAIDLVGLPGTISDLGQQGFDAAKSYLYEKATGEKPTEGFFAPLDRSQLLLQGRNPLGGSVLRETASDATGGATEYEPKTTAGEYASTVGEFVPGAVAFGGVSPANLVRNAVLPGVGSEAAGQAVQDTSFSDYEPVARVVGSVAGALAPSAVGRLVTPNPISAERAAAADTLKKEGVEITAGQKTGSTNLRNVESELGGAAYANKMERQGEQFTKAALKRAGIDAERATPEVIDEAFNRIGQQFDDLASRNTLVPDKKFAADVGAVIKEYDALVPEASRAPVVMDTIADIGTMSQGGLSGEAYQAIRSRLDKAARSSANDPQLSNALSSIRNALDENMERTIAKANPDDLGAWKEVRRQYRNMMVLEKAATGPGENAAMGIISPSKLRQVAAQQNQRAYARGKGDFAELARAGEAILKPLPNSGTAGRTFARNLFTGAPAIIGAGGGAAAGGLTGAMAGAAAGAIAPAVAGRALLSRPVASYLANQTLAPMNPSAPALLGAAAQPVIPELSEQAAPQRWPRRTNTKPPSHQ